MNTLLLTLRRYWYQRYCSSREMRALLACTLPSSHCHWREINWLAVDLETTSLDCTHGEIASVGWVPINNGVISLSAAQHHYIATEKSVGQSAVIHQIRDADLADASSIDIVMKRLAQAATGSVLVFHNAKFDMGFLNKVSRQLFGVPFLAMTVDTLFLEQRRLQLAHQQLLPNSLRLGVCRERYGLPKYPAHNALSDALATAELLLAWIANSGDCDSVALGDCLL